MGYAVAALALAMAFHPLTPAAPPMSRAPEIAICTAAEPPICETSAATLVAVHSKPQRRDLQTLFPFDASAPCPGGTTSYPGPDVARQALPRCADYVAAQPPASPALATALAQQGMLKFSARMYSDITQGGGVGKAAEEALATFDKALAIDPDNLIALLSRVAVLGFSSSRTDAAADVEHLRAVYPDDPRVRIEFARLMMSMGTAEQALSAIDSALEVLPDEAPLHLNRAEMLTRLGEADEALAEYDLAIELQPINSYALFKRAELELAQDKATAALADAERARDLHYPPFAAEFVIAKANLFLGNLEKALEAMTAAEAQSFPQSDTPVFALYRFSILDRLGRQDEADEALAGFSRGIPRHILKVQVFLRNKGFDDVPISGVFDEVTKRHLAACLLKGACMDTLSRKL